MNEPKHLFECSYPTPTSEVIYKKHPKLDLMVSNLGTVEDQFHTIYNTSPPLAVVVYETWRGERSYTDRIVHLNHNPYDYRPENLERYRAIEDKEARLKSTREFTRLTVEQMLIREKKFCSCEEAKKRWKDLNIPKFYVKPWEAKSPLCRNNKAK